jgi:hypothetical protein
VTVNATDATSSAVVVAVDDVVCASAVDDVASLADAVVFDEFATDGSAVIVDVVRDESSVVIASIFDIILHFLRKFPLLHIWVKMILHTLLIFRVINVAT